MEEKQSLLSELHSGGTAPFLLLIVEYNRLVVENAVDCGQDEDDC
jgi:hypothetical protein